MNKELLSKTDRKRIYELYDLIFELRELDRKIKVLALPPQKVYDDKRRVEKEVILKMGKILKGKVFIAGGHK